MHQYAMGGWDALGRRLPENLPLRKDKLVGLFYFLWNGEHGNPDEWEPRNISDILRRDPLAGYKPDDPVWGVQPVLYYWGEPLFGYYRSRDPWVIGRHVEMFVQAGVDFVLFDATNAFHYRDVALSFLEELDRARSQGMPVPRVAYFTNSYAGETARRIYDDIYSRGLYRDLWLTIDGKPLLVGHSEETEPVLRKFFTIREAQWPNEPDRVGGFPWISFVRPQKVYGDKQGKHSVMCVSPAQHPQILMGDSALYGETGNWGRSYHHGEHYIRDGSRRYGYNFQEQWDEALKADPDMVFVTGWNEWTMNRLEGPPDRPVRFVDNADEEYSRDIEPMRGGHGDNYYMQMIDNIRRYKGQGAAAYTMRTVCGNPLTDEDVWKSVSEISVYRCSAACRDYPGFKGAYFTNDTVCNQFERLQAVSCRLPDGSENVCFRAVLRANVAAHKGDWLCLRLYDASGTAWVVRPSLRGGASVERLWAGETRKMLEGAKVVVGARDIRISFPSSWLRTRGCTGFQWVDSVKAYAEDLDAYVYGNCVPLGRMMYLLRQ